MAPVEFEYEPRCVPLDSSAGHFRHTKVTRAHRSLPLALAVLRVAAATYASYTVGRSLYRSHRALGPAQDTRQRSAERAKLTAAFESLAALGLVFAVTSGLEYLTLSYKVWASERGIQVPDSCVPFPPIRKSLPNMRSVCSETTQSARGRVAQIKLDGILDIG
jgi:hypothetical protein